MASLWMSIRWRLRQEALSRYSWNAYDFAMRAFARPRDQYYLTTGLKVGKIAPSLADRLRDALKSAGYRPYSTTDCDPHYLASSGLEKVADRIRDSFHYFDIAPTIPVVHQVCDEIRGEIESCLGSGWRVLQMKSWASNPKSEEFGPNDWHLDGLPQGIYKIMIYLTGAGADLGTTEIKLKTGEDKIVEGPAGTFALFDTSRLWHRGLAPRRGERIAMELTICRSRKTDTMPVFGGQNARHPIFPWLRGRSLGQTNHAGY